MRSYTVRLSIIIPALNEQRQIGESIRKAFGLQPDEVLVADGGSHDQTALIARNLGATVISCPPGRSTQQNLAASAAQGDWLLFLHADTWLAPAAADQLQRATRQARACWGCFQQRIDSRRAVYRIIEAGNTLRARAFALPFGDQGIFVEARTFREVGGFPAIRFMEDLRLARQLRARGRPLLLAGPLHVSPRRWEAHGVLRQTLRNWSLLVAEKAGVQPDRLATWYARHDETSQDS